MEKIKKPLLIVSSCFLVICIILGVSVYTNHQENIRFLKSYNDIVQSSVLDFNFTDSEYVFSGTIDKDNKKLLLNISDKDIKIVSAILDKNILYVDMTYLYDYILNKYPDDEDMVMTADSIHYKFEEMKYISTSISQVDVWDNLKNLESDSIPEGDMTPFYKLAYYIMTSFNKLIAQHDVKYNQITLDYEKLEDTIYDIKIEIESNSDFYEDFFETTRFSFGMITNNVDYDFNLFKFTENAYNTINSIISENNVEIIIDNDKLTYSVGNYSLTLIKNEVLELPNDLNLSYDLDEYMMGLEG